LELKKLILANPFLWNADDGFNCLCIPLWKGVPGMYTKVS
jgi:hypothetical protein